MNVIAERVLRVIERRMLTLIYACWDGVQIAWRSRGASGSLLATGSPGTV